MKALRVTLLVLFIFALTQAACGKRAADSNASNVNAPDGSTGQQQASAEQAADARVLFDRGLAAYKNDRDEEAINNFKQAVELDPDFAEAHYRLGLAYNVTKQKEEADKTFEAAVKAYEKLTKREPKNSDAYYFLGLCYEQLGKYDDAVKALKEAVKNSPTENDDKYYELASAHFKIAQYDEAVRALNKALEINPDNYPAKDLLEQARNGAERVADFRKHQQEQMRKQQNSNSNSNNSNSGANPNATPRANSNAAVPPT